MKVNSEKMSLEVLNLHKENARRYADASAGKDERFKCSAAESVRIIGRRYGLELLTVIKKKKVIRFNKLKNLIGEISTSTLTIRLNELEQAGLVERQIRPEVTARAEYSLTKKARKCSKA